MWSVTEQNHLHYSSAMFHCFKLVHWWPPTSLPLPLFLYFSVFLSSVNAETLLAIRHFFLKGIFSTDYLFTSSIHPSIHLLPSSSVVSELYCVIFLWCTWCTHISSSHFDLPLRCCHLSALAGLAAHFIICTSSSQFCWTKSQLRSVIFSFFVLILPLYHIEVSELFLR